MLAMDEILLCYWGWVRPDEDSGSLRFASILQALETRFATDLYMRDIDAASVASSGHGEVLRRFFRGRILPDRWRGVHAALSRRPYTLCWVSLWEEAARVLPVARQRLPWAPVVIDTIDVHFVREEAAAGLGLMDPALAAEHKRAELTTYQAADAVIVVTDEDARALRDAGVTTPVHVVPNILPGRDRTVRERERELLFIGGFKHAPNLDGITWFVRECWPRVRAAVPAAKLTVVGSHATPEVLALGEVDGVEVVGYVAETFPYLDRAAVSVAPLRFGGGLKGKVCEAMSVGSPVVTTSYGVQGLAARDGENIRVRDDAGEFADAVIWALTHPGEAEAMGARGRQTIAALCGPEIVQAKVLDLVATCRKQPGRSQRAAWLIRGMAFRLLALLRGVRHLPDAYKHRKAVQISLP